MTCFRESNWTVAKKTDAFYRLEHHWWEQRALVKLVSFFLLSIWGNELKAQQFTLLYQINVPVRIIEFWKITLNKVLWLFLISENDSNLLTEYLVLLRTEGQESSQSIEIIFTDQK